MGVKDANVIGQLDHVRFLVTIDQDHEKEIQGKARTLGLPTLCVYGTCTRPGHPRLDEFSGGYLRG